MDRNVPTAYLFSAGKGQLHAGTSLKPRPCLDRYRRLRGTWQQDYTPGSADGEQGQDHRVRCGCKAARDAQEDCQESRG